MDQKLKQAAIELYDRFTHEGLDRRMFMTRMVALAGSARGRRSADRRYRRLPRRGGHRPR